MWRWWLAPATAASAVAALGATRRSQCEQQQEPADAAMQRLTLKQVQVVFRHGARAPLTQLYWDGTEWDVCGRQAALMPAVLQDVNGGPAPTSENDAKQVATKLPGGCSRGELTAMGQRQAVEFGAWLRQRYVDDLLLLPHSYAEGLVSDGGLVAGRTTNFARTVATLRGVLSGLYPGPWPHPAQLTTAADVDEVLYQNVKSCERLGQLVRAQVQALREREQDTELSRAVKRAMALPAEHGVKYVDLHDALTTMATHGKRLPPGCTPAMLRDINKQATKHMLHVVAPDLEAGRHAADILRMGLGVLLETIAGNMDAPDAGPRLQLYSGHDTTIMPILVALGADVDDWPPYLSNIIFELWEAAPPAGGGSGMPTRYVRVYYNRQLLALDGAGGQPLCELGVFKERVLGPYRLPLAARARECTVEFTHEDAQPHAVDVKTGSAVQGI